MNAFTFTLFSIERIMDAIYCTMARISLKTNTGSLWQLVGQLRREIVRGRHCARRLNNQGAMDACKQWNDATNVVRDM